jgi:ribosome-associated heat shock protein Hsp15
MSGPAAPPAPGIRVDKWLWAVRAYRTRTLAARACDASHVRIGGNPVKPARTLKLGEVVEARNGDAVRVFRVVAFLERRVSAKEVFHYAEELTPKPLAPPAGASPGWQPRASGPDRRPTGRERRQLRAVRESSGWNPGW